MMSNMAKQRKRVLKMFLPRFVSAVEPQCLHLSIAREVGPAAVVARIIEPVLDEMGFRLVRVRLTGSTLQIMAERPDGTLHHRGLRAVSRAISPVLDVEDLIDRSYHLEVSSPGIDRPLVRPRGFRALGRARSQDRDERPLAGRKRFRGVHRWRRLPTRGPPRPDTPESGERAVPIGVPFADIGEAKLVLTDALIEAPGRQPRGARAPTSTSSETELT